VVKFKPRKNRAGQYIPKGLKVGRSYEDFLDFIEREGVPSWVEMDTLIGRRGGKAIMTMDFTFCNFMPAFLLPDLTSASVAQCITLLKKRLSDCGIRFGDIAPAILTDNGGEFADVFAFENGLDGNKESSLFFCDPMRSSQKPKVEKNHTLFRDIVPTGTSFDGYTQETVNLIFSHVNAVRRKLFHGKSPYDLFSFTFGADLAQLFGITYIPPEDVIQSPRLLRI
jgi:IS30 family transposase